MTLPDCETALMARMAALDGEGAELSTEQIEQHFASCEACRSELQQMSDVSESLGRFERQVDDVDLWPGVRGRIGSERVQRFTWWPFVLVGCVLLVYKLIEMLPAQGPGLLLNLVPIAGLVVLFALLKENPFKINAELTVEE